MKRKLTLRRETIRGLTRATLTGVQGGIDNEHFSKIAWCPVSNGTCTCNSGSPACSDGTGVSEPETCVPTSDTFQ